MSLVDSYMLLKYLCMFSATTVLTYDVSSRSSIFIVTKLNMHIKTWTVTCYWNICACFQQQQYWLMIGIYLYFLGSEFGGQHLIGFQLASESSRTSNFCNSLYFNLFWLCSQLWLSICSYLLHIKLTIFK